MLADRSRLIEHLQQRLLAFQGSAGWPYYAGKASRIESTAWALLALRGLTPPDAWRDFARTHMAFLAGTQDSDGLLVETDRALANVGANALVALLISPEESAGTDIAFRTRLLDALVSVKGVKLPQSDSKQNDQLQGWPWVFDTFSWVEPTGWCLLALKRAWPGARPMAVDARIREAEDLLRNRMCDQGGWNYGNATILGQDLRPYVPTTAVGLMAMQDRRDETVVQRSLEWLSGSLLTEQSTFALSLTAMCLRLFGMPHDNVEDRLADVVQRSDEAGHVQALAMATYALSAEQHSMEAMRVSA